MHPDPPQHDLALTTQSPYFPSKKITKYSKISQKDKNFSTNAINKIYSPLKANPTL